MMTIPKQIRDLVNEDHPENVLFPGYIKGDIIEGAYSVKPIYSSFLLMKKQKGIVVLEALASRQNVLVRDIPFIKGG